jgi:hypothetical protein
MDDLMKNHIPSETLALKDIHLPEPVSWWPVAPGWWILLASIIILLLITYISIQHYRKQQLKRDIGAELDHIKQRFIDTQNQIDLARSLSILMRRASISYYPAEDVAGLFGDDWLSWLDETQTGSGKTFSSETGKILLTAPYMSDSTPFSFDTDSLITLCESWLLSTHSASKPDSTANHHRVANS